MLKKRKTSSWNPVFVVIGSAFGLGLSPIMPGTCGAFFGIICHILITVLLPAAWQWGALAFVFAAVCTAHYLLTPWAEAYWQARDPSHFVLDEVAGYLLIPLLFRQGAVWKVAVIGFVLFRILDIFKLIPPARQIDENMHGPWGILLDDLISAGYVVLFLYVIHFSFPDALS